MLHRLWFWLTGRPASDLGRQCNCGCIHCHNGIHSECALYCRVHPALVVF